jgi:hypothetical protein
MPPEERTHFEIPEGAVHEDRVHSTGRSVPYPRSDLGAHGAALLLATRRTHESLSRTRDYAEVDELFVQVTTPPTRSIAREKAKLAFEGVEIVSITSEPNRALARIPKGSLERLESRIERYATAAGHPNRSTFSVIETIQPVPPEAKLDPGLPADLDLPAPCLLHLYSSLSGREQATVASSVREFVSSIGHGAVAVRPLSTGATLIEAVLSRREMLDTGREFSTVRYFTPNRVFYLTDAIALGRLPHDIEVQAPATSVAVAVIDSGISSSSPYLGPLLVTTLPQLPPGAVQPEYKHGNFVASRILYGDELEASIRRGKLKPACRLVDIPVFGLRQDGSEVYPTEGELAEAIDRALQQLPADVRVLNASVGSNEPILDGQFSAVAHVLDQHARSRNLVVVVSAGNIRDPRLVRNYRAQLPTVHWRLDAPGEALLALTVGSIARHGDQGALVDPRWLSPFSRRGPGADGGLKPELVAHGGNCYVADPLFTSRIAALGLYGDGTQVACDVGTSFAAPLVSRDAAIICGYYGSPHANLVRALLCHFANPALAPDVGLAAMHLVGLGEPIVDDCIRPKAHAATFLHSGQLRSDVFRYIPFFVPEALVSGSGRGRLRVRVTIAFDPPVNPQNPLEYSQCRMTVGLRKPQEVGFRDLSVSAESVDTARWSPLLGFEKTFRTNYRSGPWELRLRAWTRELPDDHLQNYSVVIEVIDDSETVDVWSEIEAEAGAVFRPIAAPGEAA